MRAREGFSRRLLLRASGMGVAMLPLLEEDLVRAACTPTGRKRLVTLAWGNGLQSWVQGSDTAFTLPDIMKPLEPHRADLLMPDRLYGKPMYDSHPSGGPGHDAVFGLLTGKRMKASNFRVADGPSLDYHIGGKLKQATGAPFSVVNLGVMNGGFYNWSWQGPDAMARPDLDPYHAFDSLFGGGGLATGSGLSPDQIRAARKSVLDYVQRDIGRFSRRLGKEDRDRVDAHLASVRELEGRLTTQISATCTVPTLPARFDVKSSDNFEKTLRAQIDIGVAALAAGATPVLTIAASDGVGGYQVTWLGYNSSNGTFDSGSNGINTHHAIAHQDGKPKTVIDSWFFTQLAYLLDRLKAVKEGTRSMFDDTVVLVPNNMDRGNYHKIQDLKWLIAGSGGGYFKTGRVVSANNASTTQLLTGVCNAMGVSPVGFADPAYGGELPGMRG